MTLRPGITVLIACHPARLSNGLAIEAFASIAAQTLQPAAIHLVNDIEREGAGGTRQKLLRSVETEWIAWLDSDDVFLPQHLEKLKRVADETGAIFVYSWFNAPNDPLGHFGKPFNPCAPHHTTMTFLVRTDVAQEAGFPDTEAEGPYSNEDWGFITRVAAIACERELKMTHLAERTWRWRMEGQNSSGRPGQGDAL